MAAVESWLQSIGLGQYADVFSQNAIGYDTLADLTDADLRELGLPMGHRKKFLKHVEALAAEGPAQDDTPQPSARGDVDRRQISVMFVDLVDSTVLANRMDAEDYIEVIDAFQNICVSSVRRFGGYVARYLGDGIVTYFGWPEAHEDDARRAVVAALDLVERVRVMPRRGAGVCRVHIGIATGLVLIGDLLDVEGAKIHEVAGNTPNLAARLQAISDADTILISAQTYDLVRHQFECADLGMRELKGFDEPQRVYRVVRERMLESMFDQRRAAGLTPLVGRNADLELLRDRWHRAAVGEGQVVVLSGEPGIGKSRLLREFRESLAGEPVTALSFQCSPLHAHDPFYAVIKHIEQAAGIGEKDDGDVKFDKLESLAGRSSMDTNELMPVFCSLLGVDPTERHQLPDMTPERRRELTLRALVEYIAAFAAHNPLFVIVEDVQWMDPSTGSFLQALVESMEHRAICLVATHRPGFSVPWRGLSHQTTLTLNSLSRQQSASMVTDLAKSKPLGPEVVSEIVVRSDGNPLYVEELTAAVLDAPEGDRSKSPVAGKMVFGARIPPTLHGSLTARLDRVPPRTKELIQMAAVVGRSVSYDQIKAISGFDGASLDEALAAAVESGLMQLQGYPPDAQCTFKHALIHDAAYSAIPRERRRELHGRCASIFQRDFSAIYASQPGLLAQHYAAAGDAKAAAAFFLKAGRDAVERSALSEANAHLEEGLKQLDAVRMSRWRREQELELRTWLGRVSIFAKGWADSAIPEQYGRALALCAEVGDERKLVPLEWALATYHLLRGETADAMKKGKRVLALAKRLADTDLVCVAHAASAIYSFYGGKFAAVLEHMEATLRNYRPGSGAEFQQQYGTNRRLQALRGAAMANWCLGYLDKSLELDALQLKEAKASGRPYEYTYGLTTSFMPRSLNRDGAAIAPLAEEAIALARKHGYKFHHIYSTAFLRLAEAMQKPSRAALDTYEAAMADYQAAGNRMGISAMLGFASELASQIGDSERARVYVDEGLDYARRSGEHFAQPDLLRIKGELLLAADREAEAERLLRRALSEAEKMQARYWQLSAAVSLARHLAQSQPEEAHRVLKSPTAWFDRAKVKPRQYSEAEDILARCA